MGGLFGGSAPPPPPAPKRSDAEIQAEAQGARRQRSLAKGRASTILTKGDVTNAPTAKKVLLGE